MLALRLPAALEKRLALLAKKTGRTKSYYARQALEEHIADLEDVYLAEHSLEEIRAGRAKTVPLAAALKKYGLED